MSAPYVVHIDPVALALGPVKIHWYGLMYLLGFAGGWWLGERRRQAGRLPVGRNAFGDLAFYAMMGVIVGGRVWYMLSYQPIHWIWTDPLALFRIWDGGMSFHGGLMGVLLAGWWWSRRHGLHFFDTVDFVAPLVPIGLGLGRIGNFINGELWGKPSHVSWAMIYPEARGEDLAYVQQHPSWLPVLQRYGGLPRHPSELYEFFLEGVVMFTVLFLFSRKPRHRYAVSGLFALMYGIFRFSVEFVRVPDPQLGYLAWGWLTMGQVQSIPLIVVGLVLLWMSRRAPVLEPHRVDDAKQAK
ncbi:prolipoprotein diacylglyceryl transferase [Oleiagrimonas sp. C23AA]|uniref:prolipoprotein diacylglyceryl transferase n=1 Tax=Oleiagrimonas sp. C23AA TaxID=2719047 RepID=UPI00142447AE|nr:prolipoprotein diacylglyceryl transferase [Oleiagrimonas sp. C23AA]NII11427.1 prolipoprotein diacylglyceryl transferase [Oleiagrimonas sp. C23AA]